jgi:outer membrane protein OmpA-like peptidoglycan-associated protein
MKNVFCFLLLFSFSTLLFAQKGKADKHYDSKGYGTYLELKSKEDIAKMDDNVLSKMAKSSRKTGDSKTAEKLYAIIIEKNDNDPINHLYYAQALQTNGRYMDARNHFRICDEQLQDKANGKPYDQRAKLGWEACNKMAELRAIGDVEINNEAVLNSPKIEFSPMYYLNHIIFISTRTKSEKTDRWLNDNYMDFYISEKGEDGKLGKPEIWADELKTEFHEGPSVFSKDHKTIYFTRNDFHKGKKGRSKDGTTKLKVFSAVIENGEWTNVIDLPFNNTEYDVCHPALTKAENMLVFASNQKGGYGGMDLYVSYKEGESWSKAVNLGSRINTAGDEVFPFIHSDGTLFFSSNGWSSLGGLDVFIATQVYHHPDSLWEYPFNVGSPLNSSYDDLGMIMNKDKTEGYFSSSREGGMGEDDIYHFVIKDGLDGVVPLPALNIDVCVYDDDTRLRLENAKVIIKRDTDLEEEGVPSVTNENGFTLCKLRAGDPYFIEVSREGYFNVSDYFIMPKNVDGLDEYCIGLTRDHSIEIAEEVIAENNTRKNYSTTDIPPVNYEYDPSIPLGPTHVVGKVINKDYEKPLPNASVILLNRCTGEELVMEVEDNGDFGFPLECGCEYVVKSKKNKFFGDNQIISLVNAEDCDKAVELEMAMTPNFDRTGDPFLVENEELEASIKKGDIIELKSIFYDYDKWNIRPDAASDLKDLVLIMKKYPSMEIELSSHTDRRGSTSYNQTLSGKRAVSAREYLINKDIKPSRIVAVGYGEGRLKNECKLCSEDDHQENRRTEVLITKIDKSN